MLCADFLQPWQILNVTSQRSACSNKSNDVTMILVPPNLQYCGNNSHTSNAAKEDVTQIQDRHCERISPIVRSIVDCKSRGILYTHILQLNWRINNISHGIIDHIARLELLEIWKHLQLHQIVTCKWYHYIKISPCVCARKCTCVCVCVCCCLLCLCVCVSDKSGIFGGRN